MRYCAAITSIVMLAIAVAVKGQATQPTTGAVEPTTPKGALKALTIALDAGDRERIRSLMYATSPMEQKMVDATSEMAASVADLKHAMKSKFGELATLSAMGDSSDALEKGLAGIDSAEQKVAGDMAMVSLSSMPRESMTLVKTGDTWKISVTQQVKDEGLTPQQVDEKMATVISQSRMLRDLSSDVTAGKYATASDAAAALRAKMSGGHDAATSTPQ
jgi:hypothetical protein